MRKAITREEAKTLMEARLLKYRQEIDSLALGHAKAKEIAEDAIFAGDKAKYLVYKDKMTEFYDRLVDLNNDLNQVATVYYTLFSRPANV